MSDDTTNTNDPTLDENGNPIETDAQLDENGNPIVNNDDTKDDTTTEPEVITIDENDYTLDENGNAVDAEGNIFKTNEELASLTEVNDEEDEVTVEDIQKLSGIEVAMDDLAITPENLAKRDKLIYDKATKEGSDTAINNFLQSNPDLYKAFIYKQQTGSLEGFSNQPYYKSLEYKSDNDDQNMNFIIEAETKRGKSVESAKRYAEYLKVNNELSTAGKEAYDYLVDTENKYFADFEKKAQSDREAQLQNEINTYGTYFNEKGEEVVANVEGSFYDLIVNKGTIGNYNIPQTGIIIEKDGKKQKLSRKEVYDYISKPVKGNLTQAHLDEQQRLSTKDDILLQYIYNLTGNNIDVLVERKANAKTNKKNRRVFTTNSNNKGKSNKNNTGGKVTYITPIN